MSGLDHQTGFVTGILSALSDSSLRPLQFNLAVASIDRLRSTAQFSFQLSAS